MFLFFFELGFRKAVENGDAFLDTWLYWSETLHLLEDNVQAVEKLLKAREIFNDEYEIEYRLTGVYMLVNETEKALYHLTNALALNYKNKTLLQTLFPAVWKNEQIQSYIQNFNQE